MGVAAATGEFKTEGLELTVDEGLNGTAHGEVITGEEDLHTGLLKAHEGTHSHAAGQQPALPVPPLLESRRGQPLFLTLQRSHWSFTPHAQASTAAEAGADANSAAASVA